MSFTDTFTGTDDVALPTYSANWGTLASSAYNNMKIKTNGVEDVGSSGNRHVGRAWANDQYSQIVALILASARVAAVVRGAASALTYYGGGINPGQEGNNKYIIFRFVAGTYTRLAQTASQTMLANDVVKLSVVGADLTLNVNGVDILTVSDANIASGEPGFTGSDAGTGLPILDTWEGDDIVSGVILMGQALL